MSADRSTLARLKREYAREQEKARQVMHRSFALGLGEINGRDGRIRATDAITKLDQQIGEYQSIMSKAILRPDIQNLMAIRIAGALAKKVFWTARQLYFSTIEKFFGDKSDDLFDRAQNMRLINRGLLEQIQKLEAELESR